MSKFKKSQILMLIMLAALLLLTPLVSSSLRPKYLYFIINLLIIALGAEAGLLSSLFSTTPLHKKTPTDKPLINAPTHHQSPHSNENKILNIRVVEKSASDKIVSPVNKIVEKLKKCPSTPSLFFIGSADAADDQCLADHQHDQSQQKEGDNQLEEIGEISGQELFTKAETFIGNFYKQLKIQREESCKRIHGFYHNHKAF